MDPGRNTNFPHPTSLHHILELTEAWRPGRENEPTDREPRFVNRKAQPIINQFGLKLEKGGFMLLARLGQHAQEMYQVRQLGRHGGRCAHNTPTVASGISSRYRWPRGAATLRQRQRNVLGSP